PLSRTSYRDPTVANQVILVPRYDTVVPHPDPAVLGEAGERLVEEPDRDLELWARPLERIHGSGLHGWGVALGLGVKATIGQGGVTIEPGIAVDAAGQHISLAEGGRAEVRRAAPGGPAPGLDKDPAGAVTAAGVTLATPHADYPAGSYLVTVEWRESWQPAPLRWWMHTPYLRLLKEPNVQEGIQIPLAQVTLDAAGAVTALVEGPRRAAVVPAGAVELRASRPFMGKVQERDAGSLRPRAAGAGAQGRGLELTVPDKGNSIEIKQSERTAAGALQEGAFADLRVRAERVSVCRDDGQPTVVLDGALGNVVAGGQGVEGDVLVRDSADKLMITLDAED